MQIKNKNILITGGSGFLGKPLIERLVDNNKITVLARNEGNLVSLKEQFPSINILPGDIADYYYVQKAMQNIDIVFHLAAMKHVGIAESNPYQCIQTNINGTINILETSKSNKCELVVGISTDKAAQLKGVYGSSKYLMEKLFQEYESINQDTKYRVVRYGNVLYSTGSVLCKWRECIRRNKPLILNNPNATRFFWPVNEAIDLIFNAIENGTNAKPIVPQMKAMSLGNLNKALIEKYRKEHIEPTVIINNLSSEENMHETMDGKTFSNEVDQYTIEEIAQLI